MNLWQRRLCTFSWGNSSEGKLGRCTIKNTGIPGKVDLPPVVDLKAGYSNSCALVNANGVGNLYIWGSNYYGQAGYLQHKTPSSFSAFSSEDDDADVYPEPEHLTFNIEECNFDQLALGNFHSMAKTKDGKAYTWGAGLLGRNGDVYDSEPGLILQDYRVKMINASENTSCVVYSSGNKDNILIWGHFDLDVNKTIKMVKPTPLDQPFNDVSFVQVSQQRVAIYGSKTGRKELLILGLKTSPPPLTPYFPNFIAGDPFETKKLKLKQILSLPFEDVKKVSFCDDLLFVLKECGSVLIFSLTKPQSEPKDFSFVSNITDPITHMEFSCNSAIFCTEKNVYTYQGVPVSPKQEPFKFLSLFSKSVKKDETKPQSLSETILSHKPTLVGKFSRIHTATCGWDHFMISADPIN